MGILNINSIALGAARQRKQIAIKRLSQERDDKLSFKETQKDVEALKTDVLEIKSMLSEIINNLQRKSSYGSS
jgi:glycerol-3-phosphate responsive antiterminator